MPQSLHIIHRGKKERGDPPRTRHRRSFEEARFRLKLPYQPEHLSLDELKKAIDQLNAN